jgi:hypothetical protein
MVDRYVFHNDKIPIHYIFPYKISYTLQHVEPVAVNYSYCTPADWYGKYRKHVEWSCNKIKILVLHLVGRFMCISIEKDARNHERKKATFLFVKCIIHSHFTIFTHKLANMSSYYDKFNFVAFYVRQRFRAQHLAQNMTHGFGKPLISPVWSLSERNTCRPMKEAEPLMLGLTSLPYQEEEVHRPDLCGSFIHSDSGLI